VRLEECLRSDSVITSLSFKSVEVMLVIKSFASALDNLSTPNIIANVCHA